MLTITELDKIIALGEGYGVEFKEKLPHDLARDLTSFANANGGYVLVGVRDNGEVPGCVLDNRTKAQIEDFARHCDPPVKIMVSQVGKVAVIQIPGQTHKPYSCSGGFFIRNGASTQKMTRDGILALLEAYSPVPYERRTTSGFSAHKDLSKDAIAQFRRETSLPVSLSDKEILLNLGLLTPTGEATNACVLLFAKNPVLFHPSFFINCAVFKGLDRTSIIDRKDFKGGLLDNLEDAWAFLKKHLSVRYEYAELKRIEKYEIPLEALREALVNAIIHRDYSIAGANISVHIFDNRVEITSPGSLLKPITPQNIGGFSLRRNELISDVFSRLPYVEKMGIGIEKIRRLCRADNIPTPEISDNGFVTISFCRIRANQTAQETANQTAQETAKETATADNLSPMQIKILEACSRHWVTAGEIARLIGVSLSSGQFRHNMEALAKTGILFRRFPDVPRHRRQKYRSG